MMMIKTSSERDDSKTLGLLCFGPPTATLRTHATDGVLLSTAPAISPLWHPQPMLPHENASYVPLGSAHLVIVDPPVAHCLLEVPADPDFTEGMLLARRSWKLQSRRDRLKEL